MPADDFTHALQAYLLPGECSLSMVEGVMIGFWPGGQVVPQGNYAPPYLGLIALTDLRLIAIWQEEGGAHWFHTTTLTTYSERLLRAGQKIPPYQAVVWTGGGVALVVQTHTPDHKTADRLSKLLVRGLMLLGGGAVSEATRAALLHGEDRPATPARGK
ncbi:MAG: hypothetical protein JW910_19200 [Anaerolineae bacterium]|nr:hypothetical protein [Anaerolineae bacterium]